MVTHDAKYADRVISLLDGRSSRRGTRFYDACRRRLCRLESRTDVKHHGTVGQSREKSIGDIFFSNPLLCSASPKIDCLVVLVP